MKRIFQIKFPGLINTSFIFLTLVSLSLTGYSQNLPSRQIEVMPHYSFSGTGDIWGPGFTVRYTNYFKKRLSWGAWLGCTVHDQNWPLSFVDSNGRNYDISIRNTASGL